MQTVNAIGKVQPEFMVTISSEASGEIVYLGVRDGDTVKKGELLVRVATDLVQTQLDQMEAAVESAEMAITIAKADMDRCAGRPKARYRALQERLCNEGRARPVDRNV